MSPKNRCPWVSADPVYQEYHDYEWGIPIHDDQKLFEALILDGFQAGLSWITILKRRENFRLAFDNFDADLIANYDEIKIGELLSNNGIIRNRAKVRAAVGNAKAYLETKQEFGSFDRYIWQFTNYEAVDRCPRTKADYRASSPESDAMSKDLKRRGFKFCGTTICYAFMQAIGMINEHSEDCWVRNGT